MAVQDLGRVPGRRALGPCCDFVYIAMYKRNDSNRRRVSMNDNEQQSLEVGLTVVSLETLNASL